MLLFCKEETLRDLIREIYDLFLLIIKSLWSLIVWGWNKILDTPISTYWKIFWLVVGLIAVIGVVIMAIEKVRELDAEAMRPTSPEEAEQEPQAEQKPQTEEQKTRICWKCRQSIPVMEYALHVQECMMRDRN